MLPIIKYISISALVFIWSSLESQVMTEAEIIQHAIENYPSLRMANLEVKVQKEKERTAFNPSQPRFTIETPTDVGLGFEVEQEFDFPAVYHRRSKWLKSQTQLATEAVNLSRAELVRDVRLAYLEAQFNRAQYEFYISQDSLWKQIASKTRQLFEGGELNKADLLFAKKQEGMMGFSLLQTSVEANNSLAVLYQYAGKNGFEVEELEPLPFAVEDTSAIFYFERYMEERMKVQENEMSVFSAERWPGIVLGYLRVVELDTEFRDRFKAGITVPLWQSQYKGEIESSKAAIEKINAEKELEIKEAQLMQLQWENTLSQTNQSLNWFETNALPGMEELITTYLRLYEGGQVDYALTLRNIADVYDIRIQYLQNLKLHNEAIIQLKFLKGKN